MHRFTFLCIASVAGQRSPGALPSAATEHKYRQSQGSAAPLLLASVFSLHSILQPMMCVKVLARKTLLLSLEPAAVPELGTNSRALILSPKLFLGCPKPSGLAPELSPYLV